MNDDFQFYDSNLNLNLPSLGFDMKGIDFTSGLRNVDIAKNLNKKDEEKKLERKVPQTVQEYADLNNISYNQALQELQGTPSQVGGFLSFPDSKLGKVIPKKDTKLEKFFRKYDPTYESYAGAEDKELEIVDGKVVGKKRPKGAGRFFAGLGDILTFGISDFDRQGGGIGGMATGLGYDVEDYDINISKKGKELLEQNMKDADTVDSPAVGSVEEAEATLDFLEKNADRINKLARDQRRAASVDALGQYVASEPIRQAFLNRAADKAAARGIDIRGKLEQMPTTQQLIAGEKQKQRTAASDAFLKEAQAIAYLQQQANQFGTGGIRPSNVTFSA